MQRYIVTDQDVKVHLQLVVKLMICLLDETSFRGLGIPSRTWLANRASLRCGLGICLLASAYRPLISFQSAIGTEDITEAAAIVLLILGSCLCAVTASLLVPPVSVTLHKFTPSLYLP